MIDLILQLLAPVKCVFCAKPKTLFCDSHLQYQAPRFEKLEQLEGYFGYELDSALLAALSAFKDRSMTALAKVFGTAIQPLQATEPWLRADLIVIPPSSAKAFRSRGFIPTRLILRNSTNHLPIIQLRLTRKVLDQRGLDALQRKANLSGAFLAPKLSGKKVLLFDDVLTSSATLQEMRRAVQNAGGEVTGFCVLARRFMDSTNGEKIKA